MTAPRINIGQIRREQIVEAAIAIIHEHGIENLSLSEIEKKTGMSRGQLTYYFHTKEDILLAVFDHMLNVMRARAVDQTDGPLSVCHKERGWERLRAFLTLFVLTPPPDPTFHSLMYTFLAQILHRDDYRERLAGLFEEWRGFVAADASVELDQRPEIGVSARTVAALIQAILHGLAVQRNADPESFHPPEMLQLILNLLGSYLRPEKVEEPTTAGKSSATRQRMSKPKPATKRQARRKPASSPEVAPS